MPDDATLTLLYDGDCPVCNSYVRLLRLRKQFGELQLIDARQPSPQRTRLEREGLDLNRGFALFIDDELYFGDRAIQALALMSSRVGVFNRINYSIFRHARLARVLYPVLAGARLLLLRLLGRQPIS